MLWRPKLMSFHSYETYSLILRERDEKQEIKRFWILLNLRTEQNMILGWRMS